MFELFGALLIVSIGANVLFALKIREKSKKVESYEVTQLLHDLTGGNAIVRIERIAPSDVLLRSPRG